MSDLLVTSGTYKISPTSVSDKSRIVTYFNQLVGTIWVGSTQPIVVSDFLPFGITAENITMKIHELRMQ